MYVLDFRIELRTKELDKKKDTVIGSCVNFSNSEKKATTKMKNFMVGFGVFILGALGQVMNMIDGEDVTIISILILLAAGIALIWFSRFKESADDTTGAIKNYTSLHL